MKKKLTIQELLELKGVRKFSMTNVSDSDTARACELADIDIIGARGCLSPERMCEVLEITKRLRILTISLGSGKECDGQFLYSCDLLGTYEGRYPRHVKKYCDFFNDSVRAFKSFRQDILSGEFPAPNSTIQIKDSQYEQFLHEIGSS